MAYVLLTLCLNYSTMPRAWHVYCINSSVSTNWLEKYWLRADYAIEKRQTLLKYYRDRQRKLGCGITPEQFDALRTMQRNKCPICERDLGSFKRHPHVDHDHQTKQVRGILCPNCNLGLGHFKDDPVRLLRAANYLQDAKRLSE